MRERALKALGPMFAQCSVKPEVAEPILDQILASVDLNEDLMQGFVKNPSGAMKEMAKEAGKPGKELFLLLLESKAIPILEKTGADPKKARVS